MEAVAAASSVAGILSLAGQAIDGLLKLRNLVKDTQKASRTLENFLEELDSFQDCLQRIHELLRQFLNDVTVPRDELEFMTRHLQACLTDIVSWKSQAETWDPRSSSPAASLWKRLRFVADKDGLNEFRSKILRHQGHITTSLSIMGRYLNIQSNKDIGSLGNQMSHFQTEQSGRDEKLLGALESLPSQDAIHQSVCEQMTRIQDWMESSIRSPLSEKIDRFETSVQSYASHSAQGSEDIQSLSASITSFGSQVFQRIDELKECILQGKLGPTATLRTLDNETFSCDAILGFEQGFINDDCVYCGKNFTFEDSDTRGNHLLKSHAFNACDSTLFTSQALFVLHQKNTHHASYWKFEALATFSSKRVHNAQHIRGGAQLQIDPPENTDSSADTRVEDELAGDSQHVWLLNELHRSLVVLDLILHDYVKTPSVLDAEQLSQRLWEIDWQINCCREGFSIYNMNFPLDDISSGNNSTPNNMERFQVYFNYVGKVKQNCPTSLWGLVANRHRITSILAHHERLGAPFILPYRPALCRERSSGSGIKVGSDPMVSNPRERVDNWLLQILNASDSAKILISHSSDLRSPRNPQMLPWLVKNIAYWTPPEEPVVDLSQTNSDGAIDSRDDLRERRFADTSDGDSEAAEEAERARLLAELARLERSKARRMMRRKAADDDEDDSQSLPSRKRQSSFSNSPCESLKQVADEVRRITPNTSKGPKEDTESLPFRNIRPLFVESLHSRLKRVELRRLRTLGRDSR